MKMLPFSMKKVKKKNKNKDDEGDDNRLQGS